MSITKEKKNELIKKFAQNEKDCGSSQVQVSVLTERINNLTEHFKTHKKDKNSQRGLLKMVTRRRSLLDYLKRKTPEQYQNIIQELGLRR
jgi:small subunit ribosomal protein S15